MTNISAIIVDDERKAIDNLSILLTEFCEGVKVIGTAKNVDEATEIIEKYKPDVVFLDIEMPKKSGFSLFNSTSQPFQTVFVTAYNQYAIRAFEVSAVDYLLKPVNTDRLKEAVERVKKNIYSQNLQLQVLQENLKAERLKKILVKHNGDYVTLDSDKIICFEAKQSYSVLYYLENKQLTRYTYSKNLSHFDKMLENDERFFRTHRSWIINMNHIRKISKERNKLLMSNDVEVDISLNKLKVFKEMFKLN